MNNNSETTVSSGLQLNESRTRDGPPDDTTTSGSNRAEASLPSRYLLSNSMQRSDANGTRHSDEENIYEDPDIFSRTV